MSGCGRLVGFRPFLLGIASGIVFRRPYDVRRGVRTARNPGLARTQALRARRIAGAALDVFGEGSAPPPALPAGHALYGLDNVVLTPHIGWQRAESRQRVVDMCGDGSPKTYYYYCSPPLERQQNVKQINEVHVCSRDREQQ